MPAQTQGVIKYIVGAALAYSYCGLLAGRMLSNEVSAIIQLGLIMGLFPFVFFGPIHFLLQFLVHRFLSQFWHPRRTIMGISLNLPLFVVVALQLANLGVGQTPGRMREALQRHFDCPLPASVNVKDYRFFRGMTEGSYTFVFSINPNDLGQFLTNSGCTLNTSNVNEAKLHIYRENAEKLAKGAVIMDSPYAIYCSETNRGTSRQFKTIVVGSNQVDILFCESFR